MKTYLISGIGADHRMFQHLRLPDGYEVEFIAWESPLPHETISIYADRIFRGKNIHEPFILIGISFGGMVAVEIAKKYHPVLTIIISSIPLSTHLPKYYQLAGKLRINEIIPTPLLKWMTILKQQMLMKSVRNKKLIWNVILDGDNDFIRWGLNAVLQWNNGDLPPNLYHIHGNRDSVFPISYTNPTHQIDGGHMLILDESAKVNTILREILTMESIPAVAG